ncbi:MAG: MFS transporter [Lachnospiraceae bacterium]|nr:MFS transporter [Lachnospiraceae bacterium]
MDKTNWKKNFYILWTGQAISILTSAVLQMALIWHLTAATQSAMVLSMASIAGFLPNAVVGMLAGTLVDRMNRKAAMIGADLFIAAVSLILVAASWNGEIPVWLILVILAVRSVGTAFHTPAISAAAPLLVPVEELTRCSGYTQSLQTVGYIAGTAIAGVLYPVWNISGMVALDVAGALLACLAVAAVKIPALEKRPDAKKTAGLWGEMKEGYLVLKRENGLFALLWIAALFMILYSPINALFPLMSLDYFGGTTVQASIAEIAFSIGMLAGGVVLGIWGGLKNRGYGIALSILLMGLPLCFTGMLPKSGFWFFAFFCIVMGISVPFYNGPVMALMQEKIAPEYLGRVFGLYGSVASLAMPIGLVLSGTLADDIGVVPWFLLSGILITLLAGVCLLHPAIRKIDAN